MEEIAAIPANGFKAVSTFSGCGGSSLGYRMAEVPSHEYERAWGKSKLATSSGWRFLLRLARDIV